MQVTVGLDESVNPMTWPATSGFRIAVRISCTWYGEDVDIK